MSSSDDDAPSRTLKLHVTPFAQRGDEIVAFIEASNVPETLLEVGAPDTVVMSPPIRQIIGHGSFKREVKWTVEHVQAGVIAFVEITATAGAITQTALCRITP